MKMKKAFTLAEVLITLAIIGVVAAISIPSVVANTQQKEYQTGLRKAVSVLNSAITMNMALDGETPYENKNLYKYLARHMSIIKSMTQSPVPKDQAGGNVAFYTTDGMRFEFLYGYNEQLSTLALYENPDIHLRAGFYDGAQYYDGRISWLSDCGGHNCAQCGSYGLASNTDNTKNAPCLVVVDVNGDRKPFPQNAACYSQSWGGTNPPCKNSNPRKYGDPSEKVLTDTFSIMITDKQAIPYGQAAQKAMYQAQKSK